jgi:hypothetical protein
MPADCHAMLHANEQVWGVVHSIIRLDGAVVYPWSARFELDAGESLLVPTEWWPYDTGYCEVKDSAVCESHGDSAYQLVWDFLIGPRHHGGIGISRIVQVPGSFVDTFWTQTPELELANYGPTADSGWAFVMFSDTGQDRVVHVDSMRFSLEQGEHQDVAFQSFRFHALGPYVGVCGWKTFGGDTDSMSWHFDVVDPQRPDIRIVRFITIPLDTIDTLRTWQPCVEVKNLGTLSESVWVALKFSDTLADRTVYADSHHLLLYGGQNANVSFRSIRFNVPGPYHGQLTLRGLHGESDSTDWDFWVDGSLGVEERAVGAGDDGAPSVARGVLFMEARGEKREARSELLDISGRKVLDLMPGANDVSRLSPGLYFVRAVSRELSAVSCRKVVITR